MNEDLKSFHNGATFVPLKDAGKLPAPTQREQRDHDEAKERLKKRRAPLPLKVKSDGDGELSISQTVRDSDLYALRLMDVCGTCDSSWMNEIIAGLGNANIVALSAERAASAGLAFLNGLAPQNEVEAALGAQMFTTHTMMMRMANRAEHSTTLDGINTLYNQYNKLARTFTAQTEALAKLRGGGKQVVEVSHTHIDARNSQNVIGKHVTAGGGGNSENGTQPHAQSLQYDPGTPVTPLLCEDPQGNAVPVTSDQVQS